MSIKVTNKTNFKAVENKVRAAIENKGWVAALKMEGEAKKNKPWITRSSNAENSIKGEFKWQGKHAVITLSGNMNYSVFLELAHGKKYAILVPTIQKNAPEVIRAYKKVVG